VIEGELRNEECGTECGKSKKVEGESEGKEEMEQENRFPENITTMEAIECIWQHTRWP